MSKTEAETLRRVQLMLTPLEELMAAQVAAKQPKPVVFGGQRR